MQGETKHNWGWCDKMVTHCVEWNLCIHTLECYTKPYEDNFIKLLNLKRFKTLATYDWKGD